MSNTIPNEGDKAIEASKTDLVGEAGSLSQLLAIYREWLARQPLSIVTPVVLLIGSGNLQSQQVSQRSQRVYGHVYFGAFALLGSIIPRSCATLRSGLEGMNWRSQEAVEYGSRWLRVSPLCHTQHLLQIMHYSLEQ